MNSDRTRVTMIVQGYKPAAITNVDKIIKLIDRVVESLIRVEYSFSELIVLSWVERGIGICDLVT